MLNIELICDGEERRTMKDEFTRLVNMESIGTRDEKSYRASEDDIYSRADGSEEKMISGIFEEENQAIRVINGLKKIGYYYEDDITAVAKDKKKLSRLGNQTKIDTKTHRNPCKVIIGAAAGGALGAMVAAVLALGILTIPGIGPILAAGPIVGIFGGTITGGVAGGLISAFIEIGVNEKIARTYRREVKDGKIVILVENRNILRDDVYKIYRQNNSILDGRSTQR